MGEFSPFHWLVVLAIVVLLFGGKKIPEVMRGLGEGIRNFKEGMHGAGQGPAQTTQVVCVRAAYAAALLVSCVPAVPPTQVAKQCMEPRKRQSHNIEVTALDAGNIASCTALNGIPAGLIERFATRNIGLDFTWIEQRKRYSRSFHGGSRGAVRQPKDKNSGKDKVGTPAEIGEHFARVRRVARLAEDFAVELDSRIGADDDGRFSFAGQFSDGTGFCFG